MNSKRKFKQHLLKLIHLVSNVISFIHLWPGNDYSFKRSIYPLEKNVCAIISSWILKWLNKQGVVSVNVVTVYYVSSSFYFPVSTKRGTKIRHVQIESKQSETDLQEDLCVLAMLTLPYEFQFRWHYWMELPMKPKAPGTIVFLHQKQLNFFRIKCHFAHHFKNFSWNHFTVWNFSSPRKCQKAENSVARLIWKIFHEIN